MMDGGAAAWCRRPPCVGLFPLCGMKPLLICAMLWLATILPAAAQLGADEAQVAQTLAENVIASPPPGGFGSVYVVTRATAFDSAVSRHLTRRFPAMSARHTGEPTIGTRGIGIAGDTAKVLWVASSRCGEEECLCDIYTTRMIFVRQGGTWRFVEQEYVDAATVGRVRG
jgi:hypothetical protein